MAEHENEIESLDAEVPDYAEARLSGVLAEIIGTDAEVKIYRANKQDARGGVYLFALPSDEADLTNIQDILRDEYGGGNFRVQVRREGRLIANRQLMVEAPKRRTNSPETGIADLLETVRESARQQMELLREQMRQQQLDMQKMQLEQARQQTELMGRLLESRSNGGGTQEILQMLLSAKEFLSPATAPQQSDSMDTFLRGLEMGREMGGDPDVLSTAIKTFGGSFASILAQPPAPAPVARPLPQAPAATRPLPPPEPDTTGHDNQRAEPMNMNELMPYLNLILTGARANSDVTAYAVIVVDAVPEELLRAYIVPQMEYDRLANHPVARAHRAWLDQLRETVLQYLDDLDFEPENGADTVPNADHQERGAGDQTNPGHHAGIGGPVQNHPGSS